MCNTCMLLSEAASMYYLRWQLNADVRSSLSASCSWMAWKLCHIGSISFSIMLTRCVALISSSCERPRIIEALRGKEIIDIACGGAHSAAITCHRDVYTWGKGRYGRLGHGDSEDQLKPKLVGQNRRRFVMCVDMKCTSHFFCYIFVCSDL
jgi:hypothetical protein